jgi:serine/threonine protein kinase
MIGKKLGHYEIQSLIGAGGMGEVYRARDARLDRTVAVKVLPAHLSNQPELRERFDREARTISSLNHPHICTLFDVGRQDGIDFLVMEYLDGETLAERLKKGLLPLDRALSYALDIADALNKAHRQGIVHRDLKPGNIMLTASGPKLLDFGLAKLTVSPSNSSQSFLHAKGSSEGPTVDALTMQGAILGTLQYMPPEQLEGQDADARADIFAFGAVLYEMITGRAAFEGKSQVTLISAIVSSEPSPASTLRPDTPPLLDHVLKRCLAKDPNARWQTASDLFHELKWIVEEKPFLTVHAAPSTSRATGRAWIALSAILALSLIALAFMYFRTTSPDLIPMRLSVLPPDDSSLSTASGAAPWPTLSPDGRRIVFGAVLKDGRSMLFLRSLESDTPQPLNGTEDGEQPFWSPDGASIAFFAQNKLKRIDITGGAPQTICNVPGLHREGAWSEDGTIIFAVSNTPLWRVPATGGQAQMLMELDKSRGEIGHLYPSFLPDKRHFVFLAQGEGNEPSRSFISIGSLDSKSVQHLINTNSKALYAAPGYLLYVRESALVAQSFDAKRLELRGQPVPVVENIRHTVASGIAAFSTSKDGTIAYRTGDATENYQLAWIDRSGREISKMGEPGYYLDPEISPDGTQVAVERSTDNNNRDIWLLELARGLFRRFTSEQGFEMEPIWTRDGSKLVYATDYNSSVVIRPVSGGAKEEALMKRDSSFFPNDWSPDGKSILYQAGQIGDLWIFPVEGDRKAYPLMQTPFSEFEARFSPNGHWITYTSNESGRFEVYAQSYPSNENKIQISTEGGNKARWSRDGKEIFYLTADDKLMAVAVNGDKKLEASRPQFLFQASTGVLATVSRTWRQPYDVSPDGKRFLFLTAVQAKTTPPITVFANWQTVVK